MVLFSSYGDLTILMIAKWIPTEHGVDPQA